MPTIKLKVVYIFRNIKNLRDISFFLMIYVTIYLIIISLQLFSKQFIIPYTYLAIVSIVYFLIANSVLFENEQRGRILYNIFICLFFFFSTLMGTRYSLEGLAVTFNVILVLLPFLSIDPPRYTVPLIIINVIIFIILAILCKSGQTRFNDIFDAIIFGFLSIYCNFVITTKLIRQFAYEMTIEKEKNYDGLTHVYTKKLSQHLISESLKSGYSGVLLIIDIDKFKHYNDEYGHIYGDEVLVKVAKALQANFRKDDIIGRFGGDEFIVFMKDATLANAKVKTENYQNSLKSVFDEQRPVTCSIGMAAVENGFDYETLLKKADQALYFSKENGRNQFHIYKNDVLN